MTQLRSIASRPVAARRVLLGALLLSLSSAGQALSIGQPQAASHLSEPLIMSIQVTDVPKGMTASEFSARLLPAQAYQHSGIDLPQHPLNDFRVSVHPGRSDEHQIRIISHKALHEPILSLLLELRVGSEKWIRQVDVLLDPAVAETATAGLVSNQPLVYLAPARVPSPSASVPAYRPGSGKPYGPVRSGESLSRIAQRARPDPKIPLATMVAAIRQANPEAFQGSIDQLKKGVMLRIPSAAEIAALNPPQLRSPASQAPDTATGSAAALADAQGNEGGKPATLVADSGPYLSLELRLSAPPERDQPAPTRPTAQPGSRSAATDRALTGAPAPGAAPPRSTLANELEDPGLGLMADGSLTTLQRSPPGSAVVAAGEPAAAAPEVPEIAPVPAPDGTRPAQPGSVWWWWLLVLAMPWLVRRWWLGQAQPASPLPVAAASAPYAGSPLSAPRVVTPSPAPASASPPASAPPPAGVSPPAPLMPDRVQPAPESLAAEPAATPLPEAPSAPAAQELGPLPAEAAQAPADENPADGPEPAKVRPEVTPTEAVANEEQSESALQLDLGELEQRVATLKTQPLSDESLRQLRVAEALLERGNIAQCKRILDQLAEHQAAAARPPIPPPG